MTRTKYEQGNGFLVVQDKNQTYHIPINHISHLKSGKENHAIIVLKSGREIYTKHWMNRARLMVEQALAHSKNYKCPLCKPEIDPYITNDLVMLAKHISGSHYESMNGYSIEIE